MYRIRMTIGSKSGQTFNVSLTGVPALQTSRSFKRRGDPKTTLRHCRHTCTSVCQASPRESFFTWQSNISRRTLFGSMLIVTVSFEFVVGDLDAAQKTYIVFRSACHDAHNSLPSINRRSDEPSESRLIERQRRSNSTGGVQGRDLKTTPLLSKVFLLKVVVGRGRLDLSRRTNEA